MNLFFRLLIVFFIFILSFKTLLSANFLSKANFALVVDFQTGAILYEKNATRKVYPASMSKLMTLYILFEEIENGNYTLDTKLEVSEKAWR